jgi:cytochrome c peroxidase
VSLRQFTNNAFNHHHGIQTSERFGDGTDPDGDGHYDELTRADVTAVSVFQATLPVPGQVVPNNLAVEEAIYHGERLFSEIGCASCHTPRLPLNDQGWVYTEPNPYNPDGNLRPGDGREYRVDLSSEELPGYRLEPDADGIVWVPAFTDLKLYDITTGAPDDPAREPLNINAPGGSEAFLAGNSRFLTKKLWGAANERPYFHHGKFTTLREATLAHYGQAKWTRDAFVALPARKQDQVIEFLKSLQVLPASTKAAVVDEKGDPKIGWPPKSFFSWRLTAGAH